MLTQIALLAGAVAGLGLWLTIREFIPAQPSLTGALDRLGPQRPIQVTTTTELGLQDRIGMWVHTHTTLSQLVSVPTKDLAVLRIPTHQLVGEKILAALIGLLFPPVAVMLFALLGVNLGVPATAGACLVLAGVFFVLPDVRVRADAKKARAAFARAVGAYIELVALNRNGGGGTYKSLEDAAKIGRSWPFERIREEITRTRLAGQPPWSGLQQLSYELDVPQLGDLADIMRRAGTNSEQVHDALRARARSFRIELLIEEQAKGNGDTVQMSVPLAVLALLFLVLLAAPLALRLT